MTNPPDPSAFTGPLRQMEDHIGALEARGEEVPAEAYALVARLRELVTALQDLTATLPKAAEEPGRPLAPPSDDGALG